MCVGRGEEKVDCALTCDCWHGRLAVGLSLVWELSNSKNRFNIGLSFRYSVVIGLFTGSWTVHVEYTEARFTVLYRLRGELCFVLLYCKGTFQTIGQGLKRNFHKTLDFLKRNYGNFAIFGNFKGIFFSFLSKTKRNSDIFIRNKKGNITGHDKFICSFVIIFAINYRARRTVHYMTGSKKTSSLDPVLCLHISINKIYLLQHFTPFL